MALSFKDKIAYVNKFADKSDEKLQKIIKLSVNIDSPKLNLTDEQKDKIKSSLQTAFERIKKIEDETTKTPSGHKKQRQPNLMALTKQIQTKQGISFEDARAKAKQAFAAKKQGNANAIQAVLQDFKKKVGKVAYSRATYKTDIKRDMERPALKEGKRKVTKQGYTTNEYGTFKNKVGSVYYENRANRIDINQPSKKRYPKLANGGGVGTKYIVYLYFGGESRDKVVVAKSLAEAKKIAATAEHADIMDIKGNSVFAKGGKMGYSRYNNGGGVGGNFEVINFGGDRYDGGVSYEIKQNGKSVQKGLIDGDSGIYYKGKHYDGLLSLSKDINAKLVDGSTFAKGGAIEARYKEGKAYGRSNPIGKRAVVPIQMDKNFSFYEYMQTMKKPTGFNVMGFKDGKSVKLNDAPVSKKEADKIYDQAKRNGYKEVQIEGVVFGDGGMTGTTAYVIVKENRDEANDFEGLVFNESDFDSWLSEKQEEEGEDFDADDYKTVRVHIYNPQKMNNGGKVGSGTQAKAERDAKRLSKTKGKMYVFKREDGDEKGKYIAATEEEMFAELNSPHKSSFVALYGNGKKYAAEGGMTEHGLKKGDTITDDMSWEDSIVVKNEKSGTRAKVNLNTGKRVEAKMADGGEFGGHKLTALQKKVYKVILNRPSKSMTTYNLEKDVRKALDDLYYMGLMDKKYIGLTQEATYSIKAAKSGKMKYSRKK